MGIGFAASYPSTQHQAVGFFFTTMYQFTGQLLYKNLYLENKCACSIIHPTPLIYPPVIIFCSPN